MPTEKTIDALSKDPERAARLAGFLLALTDGDWTPWELTFLAGLIERTAAAPLSYRQSEKLLELEDRATLVSRVEGLSIAALIRETWMLRLELEPEDEAWVEVLYQKRATSLRRGAARRLIGCLRTADPDLLHGYVDLGTPASASI
jgi:uncharacterized protein YbjT (DUF2867 family)